MQKEIRVSIGQIRDASCKVLDEFIGTDECCDFLTDPENYAFYRGIIDVEIVRLLRAVIYPKPKRPGGKK